MATRLIALAAEKKYPWLTTVLDTYYISDSQVEEHLARIAKKGINPACHKGCHACCLKATVPFTEPELTAISWYASEVLSDEIRARVKQRLFEHAEILECPFLAMITTSSKASPQSAKRSKLVLSSQTQRTCTNSTGRSSQKPWHFSTVTIPNSSGKLRYS